MALSDDLTSVLRASPELTQAPSLALAAAQTPDPVGNGQALAQAGNTQAVTGATADLAARHGGGSFLGHTFGFLSTGWKDARHILGAAAGGAAKVASLGTQEAQHQYRYFHDVIARHGLAAGVLELGILGAGAAAGIALAPETGGASLAALGPLGTAIGGLTTVGAGVIGGEAAVGGVARLNPAYSQSWDTTINGEAYRDPHSGQKVSAGRDVAGLLGLKDRPGLDAYSVISGITDGFFTIGTDPLQQLGTGFTAAREARIGIAQVEDVRNAVNADSRVASAMDHMATLTAGEVPLRYPKFAALAERIGASNTREDVIKTFEDSFAAGELTSDRAPVRSVLGALGGQAKVATQEATGPVTWAKAMLGHLPDDPAPEQTFMSNLARKLTNNVPTALKDDGTQVTGAFDVMSNDAVRVVHQTLRAAGAPNRVAEDVATTFASTRSIAQRINIYKNAVVEAVLSQVPESKQALLNDSQFIRDLRGSFDEAVPAGTQVGRAEQYGNDIGGQNLSKVMDSDGGTYSAGILASHTGLTAIPNYDAVRDLVRAKSGFNQVMGKTDDFFLDHFTQKIFKPLVLVQPGTGMRIAAAEATTGIARFGLRPYIRDVVQKTVDKMRGPQSLEGALEPAEASTFHDAMGRLAGGVEKLGGLKKPDAELMAQYLEHTAGNKVPMALRAGHGIEADLIGQKSQFLDALHSEYQNIPEGSKLGDTFAEFGNTHELQSWHWQAWLRSLSQDEATQKAARAYLDELPNGVDSATEAASKAAKEHWDAQPPEILDRYHRHFDTAVPGADPHTEWGQTIAENLKGATHTPDGVPNLELLKAVAEKKMVTRESLDQIPILDRPPLVPGRTLVPDTAGSIEKIASWGHKKFVEPIVNTFAREPLFFEEWKNQYRALEKGAVKTGEMSPDEAMTFASKRAIAKMRPLIHNVNERSLFSRSVQNWIPFYFAQEQAYRRLGRLLIEDPGAFRRAQLSMSALHDIAHPLPGPDGTTASSNIAMPGTGFLGKGVPAIMNTLGFHTLGSVPVSFAGSLQSLTTVSPLVEDVRANFGPVVVFAGKTLAHIFPETTAVVDKVIGPVASSGSAWDSLIPNTTLRRIWGAQRMDSRANVSAMVNIIQLESYRQEQATAKWIAGGSQGPEPRIVPGSDASAMDKQKFLDKVKNHTRILDYLKAAIGFVSPVSPSFKFGDAQLSPELQAMIKEKGGNLGDGVAAFLEKHPDATPYTVFQSSSSSGSPIQATHPAQQFIHTNIDAINKYPLAFFYLVPQTGAPYDSAVYNEQLAMGLRTKRTPEEFLKQVYIAQGNEDFYAKDRPAYTAALVAAKGDKTQTAKIKANWKAFVAQKAVGNPVWFDDYTSQDRQNAQKATLAQLQTMYAAGEAPAGPMTAPVGGLLKSYQTMQAASMPGRTDQVALAHRKALNVQWEGYLDGQVQAHPELAPVINRLFRTMSEIDRLMAGLGEKATA